MSTLAVIQHASDDGEEEGRSPLRELRSHSDPHGTAKKTIQAQKNELFEQFKKEANAKKCELLVLKNMR